mgnify:CR=1 FL=1
MHSETAIITSNRTSLPEVAGNAAVQVGPQDLEAISQAMQKVWTDADFRTALIQKGKIQRDRFSWDQTYERFCEVLSTQL